MTAVRLAVKTLAELVHRQGDLHARLDGRARAEEGISVQRTLQQGRGPNYRRERPVALETRLAGRAVMVSGRMDGCDDGGAEIVIEEVKATRAAADLAHRHHASVHWAQALLYAGLLARELADGRGFRLRLLYAHPDTLETRCFERCETAAGAADFLAVTLGIYERWLRAHRLHERARDRWLQRLPFPYPQFRPFQRAMARRAYRALRDREHLLLEAPTGSGKTAAMLYPALRGLAAAGHRRVLFLTSRSTGALAVRDAVRRMDADHGHLRHVTLIAREKACFLPGTPCEPEACPYARGYYDRVRPAVVELLGRRALDPATVAEVASAHTVCPFELSLDASLWCDLVIGDYNYVFDPVVRLQRFAGDADAALLVDECHQLAPRVRDMLSLELEAGAVKAALAEPLPDALARRVRSLGRALAALRCRERPEQERLIERPAALLRSIGRLVDVLATAELDLGPLPATQALAFVCSRWARSDAWYQPDGFVYTAGTDGRGMRVTLTCLDAGPYLQQRFAEFGGHVRFSGTASPLALHARLHGEADAPVERAGNPFRAEQLAALVVADVPTYLRQRQRSLPELLNVIADVAAARPGHYLVAFPSFEYLDRAADAFQAEHPAAALSRQRPGMSDAERAAWLDDFACDRPPRLGFVVLGGVFAESVDFAAARLAGVICVGVGLPPPSLTRAALAAHFDRQGLDGSAVAYHQPAMVKVLQMAGRLLRGPGDRGVLCLVDDRFTEARYQQFFPAHWLPERVGRQALTARLAAFWAAAGGGDLVISPASL